MKPRHHLLDIYGVNIHLATDLKQWKTLRRTLTYLAKKPGGAGASSFATWEPVDGGPAIPHLVIYIDVQHHATIDIVETAAHEASHGAGQILSWIGHDVRGDEGTDEPHAYLTGWLTRWIFEGCHV